MHHRALSAALVLALLPTAARADDACPATEKFAPGIVSTDATWEWRLTFAPGQTPAYWATSKGFWPATRERSEIVTSTRGADGWQPAQRASFSGEHADFDPFVAPDGHTLYFTSMRPVDGVARTDMDLWKVERVGDGWGTPVHLALPSLDGFDELYPSIDRDGNLYFARVTAPAPTGDVDIFRSRRGDDGTFGPAERVPGGVNTAQRWEFNPEIAPDGRTLLFVRRDVNDDVPDEGHGLGDIYVSRLAEGQFSAARNLGPCVNTPAAEFHPTVAWDGALLYFVRAGGRPGDFFVTELRLPE